VSEGVFLDTSGLYAVFDGDDAGHAAAAAVWEDILRGGVPLHSTDYVLVELIALLQRRLGLQAVNALATYVVPWVHLSWVDESLYLQALAGVLTAARRDLTLVDCASFSLMRRLGLSRAFALDDHFAEQGFELLPAGG
jgi:predicted nucleic acid-binding protein